MRGDDGVMVVLTGVVLVIAVATLMPRDGTLERVLGFERTVTARDDSFRLVAGPMAMLDVLRNDLGVDPEKGDRLVLASHPDCGAIEVVGTQIRMTGFEACVGEDGFDYCVMTGPETCRRAGVALIVDGPGRPVLPPDAAPAPADLAEAPAMQAPARLPGTAPSPAAPARPGPGPDAPVPPGTAPDPVPRGPAMARLDPPLLGAGPGTSPPDAAPAPPARQAPVPSGLAASVLMLPGEERTGRDPASFAALAPTQPRAPMAPAIRTLAAPTAPLGRPEPPGPGLAAPELAAPELAAPGLVADVAAPDGQRIMPPPNLVEFDGLPPVAVPVPDASPAVPSAPALAPRPALPAPARAVRPAPAREVRLPSVAALAEAVRPEEFPPPRAGLSPGSGIADFSAPEEGRVPLRPESPAPPSRSAREAPPGPAPVPPGPAATAPDIVSVEPLAPIARPTDARPSAPGAFGPVSGTAPPARPADPGRAEDRPARPTGLPDTDIASLAPQPGAPVIAPSGDPPGPMRPPATVIPPEGLARPEGEAEPKVATPTPVPDVMAAETVPRDAPARDADAALPAPKPAPSPATRPEPPAADPGETRPEVARPAPASRIAAAIPAAPAGPDRMPRDAVPPTPSLPPAPVSREVAALTPERPVAAPPPLLSSAPVSRIEAPGDDRDAPAIRPAGPVPAVPGLDPPARVAAPDPDRAPSSARPAAPVVLTPPDGPAPVAPGPGPAGDALPAAPTPPADPTAAPRLAALAAEAAGPVPLPPGYAAPPPPPPGQAPGPGVCAAEMSLAPGRGQVLRLSLVSDCRAGEAVTVAHAGLLFTERLDAAGRLEAEIPALDEPARVTLRFTDGAELSRTARVTGLDRVARVALVWAGPVDLDLHAFAPGLSGDAAHVWQAAPRTLRAARLGGGGYLVGLGDPAAGGYLAEVFSMPLRRSGQPSIIRLELGIGPAATCPEAVSFAAIWADARRRPERREVRLALDPCPPGGAMLAHAGLRDLVLATR